MKVHVAIWHHKHGTNVEAATTEQLARKVMAERVLDAMDYQKIEPTDAALAAFHVGAYNDIFASWKEHVAPDDSFEFLQADVYEEHG